jgi:quercetin dioxygenase-like cupin family protein
MGGIFKGGTVDIKTLIDGDVGAKETQMAIVTFSPGARTKFHVHDHEQILYILAGKGIVADKHTEHKAGPGQTFLIPSNENHWHGAAKDSSFSHIYIFNSATETTY